MRLDRPGRYTTPRVVDQPAVTLSRYPGSVRQLILAGLGRDTPTVIITNAAAATAKAIIERYARRMTIEQRLAEAIRASTSTRSTPPSRSTSTATSCSPSWPTRSAPRSPAACPGYHDATPDLLQRRFPDTEGTIHTHGDRVIVRLNRRAYTPVLRAANLPATPVPWW